MLKPEKMLYHNLGKSGLKVSAISLGIWTNEKTSLEEMVDIIKMCFQNGINMVETSISYAGGETAKKFG